MEKLENKESACSNLKQPIASVNAVNLRGKINRVVQLRYSPAGDPILEFGLSVKQELLGKASVGSFDAFCTGRKAEELADKIRMGLELSVKGSLWIRRYRSKEGGAKVETFIVVNEIGGINEA